MDDLLPAGVFASDPGGPGSPWGRPSASGGGTQGGDADGNAAQGGSGSGSGNQPGNSGKRPSNSGGQGGEPPRPPPPFGNAQGPWGMPPRSSGGGGGGGPRPPWGNGPDFEEWMQRMQEQMRGMLPNRFGPSRAVPIALVVIILCWLASGFYRVQPDEQGVVMRFGAYNRTAESGLNYHLPWPVETALTPRVTRINRADIGFRSDEQSSRSSMGRDVGEESLMLTGDENIVDIDFSVFWRIRDARQYLFDTRNPERSVKSAAESVMREVIGRTPIQPALTEARASVEQQVMTGTQAILDQYGAGVEITQVQLQKVDPPAAVIEAFRDVQRAAADRERARNEAEAYRNDIIPRARGEADRVVQEAQGQKESQVAEARGEAQRFISVLDAYRQSRDVTRERLYLETMQDILQRNPKVVVDDRLQGVVPFLPLGEGAALPRALQDPHGAAAAGNGGSLGAVPGAASSGNASGPGVSGAGISGPGVSGQGRDGR